MASVKYNQFGKAIAKSDLDTVNFKVMLMAESYTPDIDAHVYVSDISASRAAGTTDIATTLTISVNNTTNKTEFDFTDIVTGTITTITNAFVLYIDTGNPATSELLTYNELTDGITTPKTFGVVSGVLTITIPTDGIFSI